MADVKKTNEENFRSSLADCQVIIERLALHCKSFEEMVSLMALAADNDGQLSVLMTLVLGKSK